MTLTLLDIYNSVASQAWSMFDDEVDSDSEFENVLISSINKALSDLWCSTDFSFRRKTEDLLLMNGEQSYSLPDGNIVERKIDGKKGYCVSIDGNYLEFLDKEPAETEETGTPKYFCVDNQNIYFYPVPDQAYEVQIEYYTLVIGSDETGKDLYALKNDTDTIDIPEKLEELFKNALITKTMLYAIASEHDENYSNYKKQFETAYKLLLKYTTGITPERKVVF